MDSVSDTSTVSDGIKEIMEPSENSTPESSQSSTVAKIVQHFWKMRKKTKTTTVATDLKTRKTMEHAADSKLKSLVKEKTCLSFKSSTEAIPTLQSLSPLPRAKQGAIESFQGCQESSQALSFLNPRLTSQSEKQISFQSLYEDTLLLPPSVSSMQQLKAGRQTREDEYFRQRQNCRPALRDSVVNREVNPNHVESLSDQIEGQFQREGVNILRSYDFDNSLSTFDGELKRDYSCPIEIDFPDSEDGVTSVLKRIEQIVKTTQMSAIDLDLIKDIVVEENAEELALLDFNMAADLSEDIPWDEVKFRAESLVRGSTILNFSLTFMEPPRNPCDANVCRLIELIIKTILENLPFIQPIKKTCPQGQSDNEVPLLARFEVDKDNFLDEKIQDILKSLRATVREFLKKPSSKEVL